MATAPSPSKTGFFFPSTGIRVRGQAILLAVDDVSFPLKDRLCYFLSKPAVRLEPVLTPERGNPDAPDNVATHFYGGVVFEDGKYRMWYYACHWDEHPGRDPRLANLAEGPVCYAESDDGVHWTKPHLGQVEWRGSRRNNVIRLATLRIEGVHVIRDDTDPDPDRRYKMVYTSEPTIRKFWTIRTATSADGLNWVDGPELPFDGFIEQSSLYEFNGLYFVNGQKLERSEGGHRSGRQGYAIVSPDFDHWLAECGESFLLPEPRNPEERGGDKPYDQAHIGVGAASFGNVLVGLYCIWHNKPYPTEKDWFGMGVTSGDFGLVVSNDGLHFREPVKGHVFLHRDDSPPTNQAGIPHGRILCQGNGILNVGDETRIYHGRWANTADIKDYYAEVALATLPRDRWGALGLFPGATEGTVWSAPVTLPEKGCELALNADGASGVSVEVSGDRFDLIPAFSRANAGKAAGPDGLDVPIRWTGKALAELGGQTVRFRFRLAKAPNAEPQLYAAYLRP
jgi:hypothetical protein